MAQVGIALTVLMTTAHFLFFPPAVQSGVAANVSNTIYVPSRLIPVTLLQSLLTKQESFPVLYGTLWQYSAETIMCNMNWGIRLFLIETAQCTVRPLKMGPMYSVSNSNNPRCLISLIQPDILTHRAYVNVRNHVFCCP